MDGGQTEQKSEANVDRYDFRKIEKFRLDKSEKICYNYKSRYDAIGRRAGFGKRYYSGVIVVGECREIKSA